MSAQINKQVTWFDACHCGKLFKDHDVQDLHDCKLTEDENQEGLTPAWRWMDA